MVLEALALKVAARWQRQQAATSPALVVTQSGKTITVKVKVGEDEVGFLSLKEIAFDDLVELHWNRPDLKACEENLLALQKQVFGEKAVPVYYVVDVELQPEYRGKGVGVQMYEAALKKARPALLITGRCKGMTTSEDAMRVWKKLLSKYPSKGKTHNDAVLAVK